MSSSWRFRYLGQEYGPVTFRELVEMVREETISEGDFVRASWMIDWQRAENVVGLFRMAKLSPEELENFYSPHLEADKNVTFDENERKEWWERFDDARTAAATATDAANARVTGPGRLSGEPDDGDRDDGEPDDSGHSENSGDGNSEVGEPTENAPQGLTDAIMAAVAATSDAPEEKFSSSWTGWSRRVSVFLNRLGFTRSWLAIGYPVVVAIACGFAACASLASWSEAEKLRFPGYQRSSQPRPPARKLPIMGDCNELEYTLAMAHVVGLAAMAGYGVAGWLVNRTEG